MYAQVLRAKLHHARVTKADPNYVGSITIDARLLEQSGIVPYERVQVVDVENGNRLETYVMVGEPGAGTIQLNGAAAHLVNVGDRVIIMAYAQAPLPVPQPWVPRVAVLDAQNRVAQWVSGEPADAQQLVESTR
jgi:aspartate 1-decarboxylase